MPQKNFDKKERTPVVPLRRSPRFFQIALVDPEDPKTPIPEPQRRTRVPYSATPLNFTGKVKVSPRWRSLRSKSKECSLNLDESCNSRKRSVNSKTRSRRSTKLSRCAEECDGKKPSRSSNSRNREFKRRETRSSSHKHVDTNAEKTDNNDFTENTDIACSLTEKPLNTSKQSKSKSLKNKIKKNNSALDDNTNKEVSLSSITETPISVKESPVAKKIIGSKRKRNQLEGISVISHGWTKDQESALERAYLEAKPTPHFWKKVSKLVPGKSAQECFDKVHGSHLTPPPPRLRSRARMSNSADPTLSASKLLSSSSPTTQKPKSRKQKSHVIQRTVRHMLQNQYKEKQEDNSEGDLFSVLEPTFTESFNSHLILTTPVCHLDMELKKSSTAHHKKSLSRFSGEKTVIVSPPVLKEVKNKVLHEKYIDQLHCREESRKVASRKGGRCKNGSGGVKGESSVKRKEAVKAAKNALVFGARDAISEFECKQGMALIDIFEDECVNDDNDDDDDGQLLF